MFKNIYQEKKNSKYGVSKKANIKTKRLKYRVSTKPAYIFERQKEGRP